MWPIYLKGMGTLTLVAFLSLCVVVGTEDDPERQDLFEQATWWAWRLWGVWFTLTAVGLLVAIWSA